MDKKHIDFIHTIKAYYAENKRIFAWRDIENPYYVFISEVMLQQTQTQRVITKFEQFITVFPRIEDLAAAPLSTVLGVWQGLGYNRRAKFLHQAAQQIVSQHKGVVPNSPELLLQLPGIGAATAASIAAFAYNTPTVFIETNIRAVYIHFFFKDHTDVHDRDLQPIVVQTLDHENPRQWYYALMDYGVMLKREHVNPSRKSKHHAVQSRFEGSDRQVRGAIIRALTSVLARPTGAEIREIVCSDIKRQVSDKKWGTIFDRLIEEEMITIDEHGFVRLG